MTAKKQIWMHVLVVLLLYGVVSSFYLNYSWNRYEQNATDEAVMLAQSLASMFHGEHISLLDGSSEDLDKEEYIMARRNLNLLVHTTNPISFAYLLGLRHGQLVFLVDSEPDTSLDYSPPGQVYHDADPLFLKGYFRGKTIITEPFVDRWGTWISVSVPIMDPENGRVIAAFVIDYPAAQWKADIWKQMVPDFIIALFLLLTVLLYLYSRWQHLKLKRMSEKLAYDEALYHSVFSQAPIGVAIVNNTSFPFRSKYGDRNVNAVFENILGRTSRELDQMEWMDITHPDDLAEDLENFAAFKRGEMDGYTLEKRFVRPDGSSVWTNMKISKLEGLSQEEDYHLCLVEDITYQKEFQQALLESERSKAVLISNLPGMAYRCKYDPEWTMEFVSDGCFGLTGYPPESLVNNREFSFNDLIAPEYREFLWGEWKRILSLRKPFKQEYEITTASGSRKWVLEMGEGVFDLQGKVVALEGIILDLSDRKAMEDQLRYQGEHDPWTGLYNRQYLESFLRQEGEKPVTENRALITINLSPLHLLDMTYGFRYSQALLKRITDALVEYCSDRRKLFSVYEYRLAFYVSGHGDLESLLHFCRSLDTTVNSILYQERVSSGIGVIEIKEENYQNAELLIKNSLIAAERALLVDENCRICFFDEGMSDEIMREETIGKELSEIAAGIRPERLLLQYQPVLNLVTGEIDGLEALARLASDEYGAVAPDEFIPIAEKTRLILPLGDLIFTKALDFWNGLTRESKLELNLSVNVSVLQFLRRDFTRDLLLLIKKKGVAPSHIILEITESVLVNNYDDLNRVFAQLKGNGIRIAIDDFGTGYSSLARERELNVNYLKIDKFFIEKLLFSKPEDTLSENIISMGHKLGHCVVAEGVEHECQLEYLKENGCDKAQGFYISRPLDENEVGLFLRNWKQGGEIHPE